MGKLLYNEIMSVEDIRIVFMNVSELLRVHTALAADLLKVKVVRSPVQGEEDALRRQIEANADQDLAILNAFSARKQEFKLYSFYTKGYNAALNRLSELRESSCDLSDELLSIESESRNNLEAFLIKPVQRICKYPLFFKTLESIYPGSTAVRSSLQVVQGFASSINKDQLRNDLSERSFAIANKIRDEETRNAVLRAGNEFVAEFRCLCQEWPLEADLIRVASPECVAAHKRKPRIVFVFSECVVFAKETAHGQRYDVKRVVALDELSSRDPVESAAGPAKVNTPFKHPFVFTVSGENSTGAKRRDVGEEKGPPIARRRSRRASLTRVLKKTKAPVQHSSGVLVLLFKSREDGENMAKVLSEARSTFLSRKKSFHVQKVKVQRKARKRRPRPQPPTVKTAYEEAEDARLVAKWFGVVDDDDDHDALV